MVFLMSMSKVGINNLYMANMTNTCDSILTASKSCHCKTGILYVLCLPYDNQPTNKEMND